MVQRTFFFFIMTASVLQKMTKPTATTTVLQDTQVVYAFTFKQLLLNNMATAALAVFLTTGLWFSFFSGVPKPQLNLSSIDAAQQNPTSKTYSQEMNDTLNQHNFYRRRHGVPDLTWSSSLAASAQSHANNCIFQHSRAGENLYSISAYWSGYGIDSVDSWYFEQEIYDYNNPGFSYSTGHFTQIVWKSTRQLGCGAQMCNFGLYVVCQYDPPGNYLGEFAENVPRPLQ